MKSYGKSLQVIRLVFDGGNSPGNSHPRCIIFLNFQPLLSITSFNHFRRIILCFLQRAVLAFFFAKGGRISRENVNFSPWEFFFFFFF